MHFSFKALQTISKSLEAIASIYVPSMGMVCNSLACMRSCNGNGAQRNGELQVASIDHTITHDTIVTHCVPSSKKKLTNN